jgi:pyruvate, water dikinase
VHIHTVRGLGEGLVSGRLIPEVLAVDRDELTIRPPVKDDDRLEPGQPLALSHEQAASLAARALEIERHFGSPQDIEWVMQENGELFFLQSRPLSTRPLPPEVHTIDEPAESRDSERRPLLQGGTMAAAGQASGPAYCVDPDHPVEQVPIGSILVIREARPSYVQVIDRVAGVLAELGSVAGHFATICREFEVPLLCGLGSEIEVIRHGQTISMQAAERRVFDGVTLSARPPVPLYQSQGRLPYFRKLRKLLDTITPLHLTDPRAGNFVPEACRSFHDLIRFCHEQAVRTMFSLGDRLGQPARNRKKILSDLPFDIFVVDVGGGLQSTVPAGEAIRIEQIGSVPFLALWAGMTHPSVHWQDLPHFDWRQFSETALADGIARVDSPEYASYAVIGGDYVNLIMRFGYHFTLIDALCGDNDANNYCQFRFAGGGGEFSGRLLRLQLISTLLQQAGFQVETRGDLLDARISTLPAAEMQAPLLTLGRLLGATRLMDMTLHDIDDVHRYIETFLAESLEDRPS